MWYTVRKQTSTIWIPLDLPFILIWPSRRENLFLSECGISLIKVEVRDRCDISRAALFLTSLPFLPLFRCQGTGDPSCQFTWSSICWLVLLAGIETPHFRPGGLRCSTWPLCFQDSSFCQEEKSYQCYLLLGQVEPWCFTSHIINFEKSELLLWSPSWGLRLIWKYKWLIMFWIGTKEQD